MSGSSEPSAVAAAAAAMFESCGYRFYRAEAELRADDQKVRALLSEVLAGARKAVVGAEGNFRRTHIPPPTRDMPFPPPAILADARLLEALGAAIGALEGQIRHAPVPENDRMTQRFREEAATLAALIDHDRALVGHAQLLRQAVAGQPPEQILAARSEIEQHLAAIADSLAARRLITL